MKAVTRRCVLAAIAGMLVIPAMIALLGWLGVWPVQATATPPRWERAIGRIAFNAAVARRAPRVTNPIQATPEELLKGMRVYRDGCAGCHGSYGRPSEWGTAGFYPRVPQFADAPPRKPVWQLHWIVQHGVRYTGMGAWERLAPDSTIWQVVTFLSHLDSLPPAVDAQWRKSGP